MEMGWDGEMFTISDATGEQEIALSPHDALMMAMTIIRFFGHVTGSDESEVTRVIEEARTRTRSFVEHPRIEEKLTIQ